MIKFLYNYKITKFIKKKQNKVMFSGLVLLILFLIGNNFAFSSPTVIENDNFSRFTKSNISPIINLGGKNNQLAIQVFPSIGSTIDSKWRILRHYPSGKIEIQYNVGINETLFKTISLPPGFSSDSYVMGSFGDPNKPYLLVYNVVRNIPSGRELTPKEPGYDLYQLLNNNSPEIKIISQGINIGGIDTLVYGHTFNSDVYLCANNQCVTVIPDGSKIKWNTENLDKYEFIELKFDKKEAYAFVRLRHDDRINGKINDKNAQIQIAHLSPKQAKINDINKQTLEGIPYNLKISSNGKPQWSYANNSKSFRDLLLFELGRMPNHGWMDFGANNLEGRITWSQVYYLSGMMSLLNKNSGLKYLPNHDLDKNLRQTTIEELNLVLFQRGKDRLNS